MYFFAGVRSPPIWTIRFDSLAHGLVLEHHIPLIAPLVGRDGAGRQCTASGQLSHSRPSDHQPRTCWRRPTLDPSGRVRTGTADGLPQELVSRRAAPGQRGHLRLGSGVSGPIIGQIILESLGRYSWGWRSQWINFQGRGG